MGGGGWIAVKAAFQGGRNAEVRQTTVLLFESCVTLGKCLAFCELGFPIREMIKKLPTIQKTRVLSLNQENPLDSNVEKIFYIFF